MTNAEKFKEVFGIEIAVDNSRNICQFMDRDLCSTISCQDCPAFQFWLREYEENKES